MVGGTSSEELLVLGTGEKEMHLFGGKDVTSKFDPRFDDPLRLAAKKQKYVAAQTNLVNISTKNGHNKN